MTHRTKSGPKCMINKVEISETRVYIDKKHISSDLKYWSVNFL